MEGAFEGGAPSEEGAIVTIATKQVQIPTGARDGRVVGEGFERDTEFASPGVRAAVDGGAGVKTTGPTEVFFRQAEADIEPLIGGGDFEFEVMTGFTRVGAEERFYDVTIPQTDPFAMEVVAFAVG